MKIYTRRNAAIGYLTVKAVQRELNRRRRPRRSGFRVAAYVGLGLVSAGILAAALAIALRRRQPDAPELVGTDDAEIVGEVVTTPEPVTAT